MPGAAPSGTAGDPVSRTQDDQINTLPTHVRTPVSPVVSQQPGAGSWEADLCASSGNGVAATLNRNDYVSGWAQVNN